MTCSNRAEIIRKATLNCSTDMFDPSRSFVFHILSKFNHDQLQSDLLFSLQLLSSIRFAQLMVHSYSSLHLPPISKNRFVCLLLSHRNHRCARWINLVHPSLHRPSVCSCSIDSSTMSSRVHRKRRVDRMNCTNWSPIVHHRFRRRSIVIRSNPNDSFSPISSIHCWSRPCRSIVTRPWMFSNTNPNCSV